MFTPIWRSHGMPARTTLPSSPVSCVANPPDVEYAVSAAPLTGAPVWSVARTRIVPMQLRRVKEVVRFAPADTRSPSAMPWRLVADSV